MNSFQIHQKCSMYPVIKIQSFGRIYACESIIYEVSKFMFCMATEHLLIYIPHAAIDYACVRIIYNKDLHDHAVFEYNKDKKGYIRHYSSFPNRWNLSIKIMNLLGKINFLPIHKNKMYKDCIDNEQLIKNLILKMYVTYGWYNTYY